MNKIMIKHALNDDYVKFKDEFTNKFNEELNKKINNVKQFVKYKMMNKEKTGFKNE